MNEKIIIKDNYEHWYLIPYAALREFNKWLLHFEEGPFNEEWEGTDFDSCRIDYPSKVIILDYLMEY